MSPVTSTHLVFANQPPVPTIAVDGHSSGDIVDFSSVTVHFRATDPDGLLPGIRYNVMYWPTGSLDNNSGQFVTQSATSGEVKKVVTLDKPGEWFFWTEAQDSMNAMVTTPKWDSGFRLTVRKGAVQTLGHPPTSTVFVGGYDNGAVVGSTSVSVHFKATDAGNDLYGVRYNVWYAPANSQDNNGGAFFPESGGSAEIVKTVSLNQDGDWYFWTDSIDNQGAYTCSGAWGLGFKITVSQAGVVRGGQQTDTLFARGYPSGLANTDFVKLLYKGMLRRDADPGGLNAFVNALNAGALTHATAVDSILGSAEFKLFIAPVARLYLGALRRVPDMGGLDNWVNYLKATNSLDGVGNAFAASQEFLNRYGTLNSHDYVAQLYRDFLNREATAGELSSMQALLDSGTETRGQVLVYVSDLQESINVNTAGIRTVLDYYTFLNAPPSQSDLTSWETTLGVLP